MLVGELLDADLLGDGFGDLGCPLTAIGEEPFFVDFDDVS
jgi:hypothetical protein